MLFKGFIVLAIIIGLFIFLSAPKTELTKITFKEPPQQITIAEYEQEVKQYTEQTESLINEFEVALVLAKKRMNQRTPDEKLKVFRDAELSGLASRKRAEVEKLSHDLYWLRERSKAMPNIELQLAVSYLISMIRYIDSDSFANTVHNLNSARSSFTRYKDELNRLGKVENTRK